MLLYLFFMFTVATSKSIFAETVVDNLHFTATAIFFTLELFNCLQHLSRLPSLGRLAKNLKNMIKQALVPKGLQKFFEDEDDDLNV